MDALERAHSLIKKANECEDAEGYALTVAEAHAMAAIAQAEQLKRIADALEAIDARGDFVESVKAWGSGT